MVTFNPSSPSSPPVNPLFFPPAQPTSGSIDNLNVPNYRETDAPPPDSGIPVIQVPGFWNEDTSALNFVNLTNQAERGLFVQLVKSNVLDQDTILKFIYGLIEAVAAQKQANTDLENAINSINDIQTVINTKLNAIKSNYDYINFYYHDAAAALSDVTSGYTTAQNASNDLNVNFNTFKSFLQIPGGGSNNGRYNITYEGDSDGSATIDLGDQEAVDAYNAKATEYNNAINSFNNLLNGPQGYNHAITAFSNAAAGYNFASDTSNPASYMSTVVDILKGIDITTYNAVALNDSNPNSTWTFAPKPITNVPTFSGFPVATIPLATSPTTLHISGSVFSGSTAIASNLSTSISTTLPSGKFPYSTLISPDDQQSFTNTVTLRIAIHAIFDIRLKQLQVGFDQIFISILINAFLDKIKTQNAANNPFEKIPPNRRVTLPSALNPSSNRAHAATSGAGQGASYLGANSAGFGSSGQVGKLLGMALAHQNFKLSNLKLTKPDLTVMDSKIAQLSSNLVDNIAAKTSLQTFGKTSGSAPANGSSSSNNASYNLLFATNFLQNTLEEITNGNVASSINEFIDNTPSLKGLSQESKDQLISSLSLGLLLTAIVNVTAALGYSDLVPALLSTVLPETLFNSILVKSKALDADNLEAFLASIKKGLPSTLSEEQNHYVISFSEDLYNKGLLSPTPPHININAIDQSLLEKSIVTNLILANPQKYDVKLATSIAQEAVEETSINLGHNPTLVDFQNELETQLRYLDVSGTISAEVINNAAITYNETTLPKFEPSTASYSYKTNPYAAPLPSADINTGPPPLTPESPGGTTKTPPVSSPEASNPYGSIPPIPAETVPPATAPPPAPASAPLAPSGGGVDGTPIKALPSTPTTSPKDQIPPASQTPPIAPATIYLTPDDLARIKDRAVDILAPQYGVNEANHVADTLIKTLSTLSPATNVKEDEKVIDKTIQTVLSNHLNADFAEKDRDYFNAAQDTFTQAFMHVSEPLAQLLMKATDPIIASAALSIQGTDTNKTSPSSPLEIPV